MFVSILLTYWNFNYLPQPSASAPRILAGPNDRFSLSPLPGWKHTFGDAVSVWEYTQGRSPYPSSNYLPMANAFYSPLSAITNASTGTWVVWLTVVAANILSIFILSKSLRTISSIEKIGFGILGLFFSYPSLFLIDRGNIESLVVLFLVLGATSPYKEAAPLWIAFAASLKGYPGLCAINLLTPFNNFQEFLRKSKKLLLFLIACIAFFLIPLFTLWESPQENITNFINGILNYKLRYQAPGLYSCIDGSGWQCFSKVIDDYTWNSGVISLSLTLIAWTISAYAGWLVISKRDYENWIRWTVPICIYLLLLNPSYDYRLTHLFIPITFFLSAYPNFAEMDRHKKSIFWLFVLVLAPKHLWELNQGVTVSSVINPILLMSLLILSVRRQNQRLKPLQQKISTPFVPATKA